MTIEELKIVIETQTAEARKEIDGLKKQINGMTVASNAADRSIKKTTSSIASLGKLIKRLGIATILYKIGKTSLKVASDFEEFGDTAMRAFGATAEELKHFLSIAIPTFGLTINSAMQLSSRFKLMANSMGITGKAGTTLALNLTALAGDLASLLNLDTDRTFTALKGVFTGETESLKDLGVVMTQAKLQEFAYAQGINKSIQAMSEGEKVILRYKYVMEQLSKERMNAQGNFADTSNSWANQMRKLKAEVEVLFTTIGKTLQQLILPFTNFFSKVIGMVLAFVKLIGQAIQYVINLFGKLFHNQKMMDWKIDLSLDIGKAEESSGGLAENMGSAADNAKKIKENLAGFDELNVISEPDDGGSMGGMDFGNIGGGIGDIPDLPSYWEEVAQHIQTDFIKIQQEFEKGVNNLVEFIKKHIGLITGLGLGALLVKALFPKDIMNILDDNSASLIQKIGLTAETMMETFQGALGGKNTLKNGAKGWSEMLGLDGIKIAVKKMGETISTVLGQVGGLIKTLLGNPFTWVIATIITIIASMVQLYNNNEAFREQVDGIFTSIKESFGVMMEKLSPLWDLLVLFGEMIWEAIQGIFESLGKFAPLFAELGAAFMMVVNAVIDFINDWILPWLVPLLEVIIASIGTIITVAISLVGTILSVLGDIAEGIANWIGDVLEWCSDFWNNLTEGLSGLWEKWKETWSNIKEFFAEKWNGVKEFFGAKWDAMKEKAFNIIMSLKAKWAYMIHNFKQLFQGFKDWIKVPINGIIGFINGMLRSVTNGINHVIHAVNGLSVDIPDWVPGLGGKHFGFHLNDVQAYQLPTLATGGLAYGDTLARIGEYNGASANPEVVAPLDKLSDIMIKSFETALLSTGGENNGTYNISLELDGKQITNKVIKDIKQYEANTGKPVFNY